MDSEHIPKVVTRVEEERRGQELEEEEELGEEEEVEFIVQNKKTIEKYKEATEEIRQAEDQEGETMKEKCDTLKRIVQKAMIRNRFKKEEEVRI